jgi:serine/threonine-protein kinase
MARKPPAEPEDLASQRRAPTHGLIRSAVTERLTDVKTLNEHGRTVGEMETPYVRAKAARDPLIGVVLHDRYKVEKRIGKGGMGIVYLAEHVLLRRKVALKTLSDRAFASEELVARFHQEAMAAAAVGNEHVVAVTDMGQLDDGSYFVVLEYLDGIELAFAVEENGALPVSRAVHIVLQLCDALTAVHAAGIVHRDLKPENLFLIERAGAPDFVKVLDFGVCKVLDAQRDGGGPLTRTGESLGTPQYMAPEQIEGCNHVDPRTDVYAVGAILFYALTGEEPFRDSALPRLLMRICSEPPPTLRSKRPDLPPALEAVITRAMHKDPADRYQSAAELREALEPFANAELEAPRSAWARSLIPEPPRASLRPTEPVLLNEAAISGIRHGYARSRQRYAIGALLVSAAIAITVAIAMTRTQSRAPAASTPSAERTTPALQGTRSPLQLELAAPPATTVTEASTSLDAPGKKPKSNAKQLASKSAPPAAQSAAPLEPAAPATPEPLAPSTAEPQAPLDERAAPPTSPYRLSQRELKDVFP